MGDNELEERSGTIAQALLRMNGKLAAEALKADPLSSSGRIAGFRRRRIKRASRPAISSLSAAGRRKRRPTISSRSSTVRKKQGQKDCYAVTSSRTSSGACSTRRSSHGTTNMTQGPTVHGQCLDWSRVLASRCVAGGRGSGCQFLVAGLGSSGGQRTGQSAAEIADHDFSGRGASQLETWDPHPGTKIGGPTKVHRDGRQGTANCRFVPASRRGNRFAVGHPLARFQGRGPRAGIVSAENGLSARSDAPPSGARRDPGQPVARPVDRHAAAHFDRQRRMAGARRIPRRSVRCASAFTIRAAKFPT